ncbi:MAG: chorismate synthase [Desulfovibrio sp.]|jgi:chorismate synthase|nr:chorismate synthase [Desulfovibrio sp.]
MSGNTFGRVFRLTTYGESHGPGLGGVVDGCPAGLELSEEDIQKELDLRRPGGGEKGGGADTARNEPDRIRLLSGVFAGKTSGTPIAFHVENTNQRSADYDALADVLRPGHADLGFLVKYGMRDHRGGGRSSGRETLSRVAGGAIALKFLETRGISILACACELGGIPAPLTDVPGAALRPFFCPDEATVPLWEKRVNTVKKAGDTLGGLVRIMAFGLPAGLGEPVFDKLDARLAYAFMGIGAVKGVEAGYGFASARLTGSINNDACLPFTPPGAASPGASALIPASGVLPGGAGYVFADNKAGGVLGGLSNGAPLAMTVAVKPISSIAMKQSTITPEGRPVDIAIGGRHDISAIPRIVPVIKAMAALTIADYVLLQRCARIR